MSKFKCLIQASFEKKEVYPALASGILCCVTK